MFICKTCGVEKGLSEHIFDFRFLSFGRCEFCGNHASCADIHHSQIPSVKSENKKSEEKKYQQGMLGQQVTKRKVVAMFARMVLAGCLKTDRDYQIGKHLLIEHTGIDYDNVEYCEIEDEIHKITGNCEER